MAGLSDTEDQPDHDLLNYLGVFVADAPEPESRLVLWKENETAFSVFVKVGFVHGQWNIGGMGGLLGLDGSYLLEYIKLNFKKKKVLSILDDVQLFSRAYIEARDAKK